MTCAAHTSPAIAVPFSPRRSVLGAPYRSARRAGARGRRPRQRLRWRRRNASELAAVLAAMVEADARRDAAQAGVRRW